MSVTIAADGGGQHASLCDLYDEELAASRIAFAPTIALTDDEAAHTGLPAHVQWDLGRMATYFALATSASQGRQVAVEDVARFNRWIAALRADEAKAQKALASMAALIDAECGTGEGNEVTTMSATLAGALNSMVLARARVRAHKLHILQHIVQELRPRTLAFAPTADVGAALPPSLPTALDAALAEYHAENKIPSDSLFDLVAFVRRAERDAQADTPYGVFWRLFGGAEGKAKVTSDAPVLELSAPMSHPQAAAPPPPEAAAATAAPASGTPAAS